MPLPEYDFLGPQSKDFFSPLENVLKTLKFELFEIFRYGKSHRVRDDLVFSQLKRACIDLRSMSCASSIEIGITTSTTDPGAQPFKRALESLFEDVLLSPDHSVLINASVISNAPHNICLSLGV
jgi:hypothetical protein